MFKAVENSVTECIELQDNACCVKSDLDGNKTIQIHHRLDTSWLYTPSGDKRGYIQPRELHELWVHTGTICNLACPFCFEGASKNSKRIVPVSLVDVKPFIDEATALGVKQFSFTGGEPFFNENLLEILDYCLDRNPCLVLTNATKPLADALPKLKAFRQKKYPLSFRVSIDSPQKELHEKNRGIGNFELTLKNCLELKALGFNISIASQLRDVKDLAALKEEYKKLFKQYSLPENINLVFFPDLLLPFQSPTIPFITENCMTSYKTEYERDKFMCAHSAMLAKKGDKVHIYPCTLVDDDDDYNMGETLKDALQYRVMLRHHRCFACFSSGTSCSEL